MKSSQPSSITGWPWGSAECHHLAFIFPNTCTCPQHLQNRVRRLRPTVIGRGHSESILRRLGVTPSPELFWKDYLFISNTIFPLLSSREGNSRTFLSFLPCGIKLPAGKPQSRAGEDCISQVCSEDSEIECHASEKEPVLPIFWGKSQM